MLDKQKTSEIIDDYVANFEETWSHESYKWKAVRKFQDSWDLDAEDFPGMLERSLSETVNLLNTYNYYPKNMIVGFANEQPEMVRSMFANLFDETQDYVERVLAFKEASTRVLHVTNGEDTTLNHYQAENAITTYLWLRYPERYYIFKYGVARALARRTNSDHTIKRGAYAANLREGKAVYDELRDALVADGRVAQLLSGKLDERYDQDQALHTATIDVAYYSYKHATGTAAARGEWWPSKEEYDPGIDAKGWLDLLRDPQVFTDKALTVVRRFDDEGGASTCKNLSERYGEEANYYIGGVIALGRAINRATGCPKPPNTDGRTTWWPVAFQGRQRVDDDNMNGSYVWRLRDELREALSLLEEPDEPPTELADQATGISSTPAIEPYAEQDFLRDVYLSKARYHRLRGVLLNRKNVILQGPPGVGKTYAARRLAWSVMGCKDNERIELVQFHQSYSYEDFIMGYRPKGDTFELRHGVFYRFCQKAAERPDDDFFFIIDEINRANLSKVLGELMMLIERDYRGTEVTLPYDGTTFMVPQNLYIIGMMNTADRSLATLDYALRRRFAFFEMTPGFDSEGFDAYRRSLASETMDALIDVLRDLNEAIAEDRSLGRGFSIGHSYLCGQAHPDDEWLRAVVDFDILPMLEEYWFDDPSRISSWEVRLHGVFEQ